MIKDNLYPDEEFQNIQGFVHFKISNYGRIYNKRKDNELKSWTNNRNGYICSMLCENSVKKNVRVHILVAKAFIPNPDNKPFVNHIDGDKTNNLSNNLEWVTQSENQLHAHKTKLQVNAKGTQSKLSKVNDKLVIEIAILLSQGYNTTKIIELADFTNCEIKSKRALISRIRRKESYTNLTKDIL